jgi:hypothetical protein
VLGRITVGSLMMATGVIHNAFGMLLGLGLVAAPDGLKHNLVADMRAEGLIATVEPDLLRMTFFWFELFGALAFVLGWLMHTVERREALPASVGWLLLAVVLGGLVFLPASGLWLGLPQAGLILWRARHPASASGFL